MTQASHPCRLYLISPPQVANVEAFAKELQNAFAGGDIGAFQLRLKNEDLSAGASADEIRAAVKVLMPIVHQHEAAFILNDEPELAAELGCDGVHLGQEDLEHTSLDKVRETVGEGGVIGISCHDSMHLAMEAGGAGADYVAFGAFYVTQSKSAEKLAKYGTPTPDIVSQWTENSIVPCVAIGGMTPENCSPLVEAGADFIAVVNGVWKREGGVKKAVSDFNKAIKNALKLRKEHDMSAVA